MKYLVVVFGLLAIPANAATLEPTPAQRSACLSDAMRLCIRANPDGSGTATLDDAGIVRCMQAHKRELSRACREAFKQ